MRIFLFTLFLLVVVLPSDAFAAVMPAAQTTPATGALDKDARQQARLHRLIERFQQKVEKKLERKKAKSPAPGVWDDSRFRLGAIFILGALALAILGAILGTGLLGFLSGLAGLAGVILIVWSLIDYYG